MFRPLTGCNWFAPILVVFGAVLSGCSSLSEDDCRSGAWDAIGYDDAMQGHQQGRSVDHGKACAKYGIELDPEAYFAGYERGLEVFCNEDSAVQRGLEGAKYEGTCPVENYPRFEPRYRAGRVVYDQGQVVNGLRQTIEQGESQWQSLRYELQRLSNTRAQSQEEQDRIYDEMRYTRQRLRDIEYDINAARDRLYYEEQKLRELRQKLDESVA